MEELFEMRQKKLDRMIVRSRTKWLLKGEKNTPYLCNLGGKYVAQKAKLYMTVML